jgi:mannosyltransferase OCH1-like enzyme
MIPKVIHYCWFGHNPLPPLAEKCITSWKRYLPDYEIKEWNEENFDVNIVPYTAEAYEAKKYAFVSDFARFWILYHYGGLYFDTDVEIIRPLDDIIAQGPFMGCEHDANQNGTSIMVAPGLGLGCHAGMNLYSTLLSFYSNIHFKNPDGSNNIKNIVQYTTELLFKEGLKNVGGIQSLHGVTIYPCEYFCPINNVTKKMKITGNTRTIHHYSGSWRDKSFFDKLKERIRLFLPDWILLYYNNKKNTNK